MNQLVSFAPHASPAIIAAAGESAARRFLEFFAATIRNRNTRMAYYRAVTEFFAWVERHKIGQLVDIEPLHVAAYVETLGTRMAKPTVKQHLAAVRMCFDWLVTGGILTVNPAHGCADPSTSSSAARRRATLEGPSAPWRRARGGPR
jgi:integrase/recombinase XerD